ncbi:MAG: AbrB/MazE/SpoVT family DNA-binding domain-containing protein [Nitrososphaerota archaeon]|jgi:AbrB family looped-hinge helix DNA binding protein|nr:AbrB/MazE/SpoVT family DNA-binding domain-containing protein [Nitrososphaerota archaeon]MCL5672800.1 AbrB/MazE/SpoVT family DNA-binding domain-containing protein [Nitrososphaerota archaeon]MDG6912209.1 AbrB/MazE/SpoVT family DNA-binding domain-containing protein [Nitrososphaerota archaeon]MDG6936980.1 AbrB/MazE/SpoVT family DNA-binding domain-containing protein [Nitrososphaerota archaeon]MDG6945405.1 AbrB/MazE/SpoVT family DNA-binding domain-containing protein [Nitrososphaerota archaeon]
MEKADVVVVSSKGQVVIPQDIRQKLRIGAKSKLLVYQYEDALIMKKLEVEGVEKSLEAIYRRVDARKAKFGKLGEAEIEELVQKYRHVKS